LCKNHKPFLRNWHITRTAWLAVYSVHYALQASTNQPVNVTESADLSTISPFKLTASDGNSEYQLKLHLTLNDFPKVIKYSRQAWQLPHCHDSNWTIAWRCTLRAVFVLISIASQNHYHQFIIIFYSPAQHETNKNNNSWI